MTRSVRHRLARRCRPVDGVPATGRSRVAGLSDIARLFGVPPELLTTRRTYRARCRLARRRRSPVLWLAVPVVSPYDDRLREAALGDHECWRFPPVDCSTSGY
ncbi:hypothetical protein [Micromonospora sp. WMMC273]|uniref:hypothetical protein n=1 Tax=Micromonospora sp. WMMC273 TaxID=3015157 RepID=UPI0022B6238A|nr:hypothetical protein [Micromonospora sp. WMMC273]MCZ7478878.1 hypothetical protein [Micromonospora sp. WMMC273]